MTRGVKEQTIKNKLIKIKIKTLDVINVLAIKVCVFQYTPTMMAWLRKWVCD